MGRLKTGTCARIDAKSIDFSKMELQPGAGIQILLHLVLEQTNKAFIHTNYPAISPIRMKRHIPLLKVIFTEHLYLQVKSEGVGPRYCPSIEDKINRFRDKERHHLFIEPQTREATSIISTVLAPLCLPIRNWV